MNHETEIKTIIDRKLVGVNFQPIVSMRDMRVIGLEALSHGIGPDDGGRISPLDLFSQAARQGQVLALDRLCRETALAAFRDAVGNKSDCLLWLNFETSILDDNVVGSGRLKDAVQSCGLPPHRVVIEMVESTVRSMDALIQFVENHRSCGYLFALDDVGTGHSNLERIAQIKPDIIKVDRSLIRDIEREYHKQQVVRSLCGLARGIGALVVAEGIETEAEALTVLHLDINIHQGYFYGRPGRIDNEHMDECRARMTALADRFRGSRVDRFAGRKNYFADMGGYVAEIAADLGRMDADRFESALGAFVARRNALECLYVLNDRGVQITETVCNGAKLTRPDSLLFRPSPKGADLSLKDYFLLVRAGLPRYVSDPYISRASGNLCVTISHEFRSVGGQNLILCADCDGYAE